MIGAAYAAPQYKSYDAKPSYGASSKALKARCEFPNGGGLLNILETKETTRIFGNMNGLTDGLHGFHVHEFGGLGNGCKDAGGHFDPNQTEDSKGEYVGDLGSVEPSYGCPCRSYRRCSSHVLLNSSLITKNKIGIKI